MTGDVSLQRLRHVVAAAFLSALPAGVALAANLPTDFDEGKDGVLAPSEVVAFEAALAADTDPGNRPSNDHFLAEIVLYQQTHGSGVPIPISSLPPYPGGPDCSPTRRVFLRKSVLRAPLTGCAPLESYGDGATLSFSFDRLTDTTEVGFVGALILPVGPVPRRFPERAGVPRGRFGISETGWAAFIEGDGTYSSAAPKTGYLRGGLKADFAFAGGGFDQIVVGAAVYARSDFGLGGSGYGAQLSFTPQAIDRRLNGTSAFARRINRGERFSDHYFTASAVLDAFQIDDPGSTGLTAGDDYAWLGGQFGLKYFNNKIVETGLVLSANVDAFTDLVSGENALSFTGEMGFLLNRDGSAAVKLQYQTGKSRHTLQDTDRLTLVYELKL